LGADANEYTCSTFTLLFQDENGGLEIKDAKTKTYIQAEPEEAALVLNIGDMLQRFTNGIKFFSQKAERSFR
jgi:isopenicillin N synthase-like dioxygenase